MANNSKLWYLENFNLFDGLDKSNMQSLDKVATMRDFTKSQPVYFATEPSKSIFFLKEGRVKLTRISVDGNEQTVAIINKGEVFGEMSIIDESDRTDYAYALEGCLLCAISKEDFTKFIEANPILNLKLTRLIAQKLKKCGERVNDLVFRNATQRVVTFVLQLADEQGEKIGYEIFVKPFLSHQIIGELTACSRQTVNSILTNLRDKELITFNRKKLIVHKEQELRKLVG